MSEEIKRNFATIGEVLEDGVTLIFDGEDAPTDKHYLCNTSVEFHAGDRVRIVECDGTYIVEYAVGPPSQGGGGGGLPPGGTTGQALRKLSNADDDADWQNVRELPANGTVDYVLAMHKASTLATPEPAWTREAPAADAVVDQNTKTAYTQNKIYFRYYQGKFWARYGEYGSWVQLN